MIETLVAAWALRWWIAAVAVVLAVAFTVEGRGTVVVDWDDPEWGGHVTESETGSWVCDRHGDVN